jgi:integrase/recombinase XerD
LSSLFEYLCEKNVVSNNPVKGVKRPKTQSREGATKTIGDHQARELLAAPAKDTVKAKTRPRDPVDPALPRASTRGVVQAEGSDFKHLRRGVPHLKIEGEGEKTRYVPIHPATNALIHDYLEAACHSADENGALFRPVKNNRGKTLKRALSPDAVSHHEPSCKASSQYCSY